MIRKIWHPYTEWEDLGMWEPCAAKDRKPMVEKAISFTGDHALYGSWMMRVIVEMPKACEHNLTDLNMNRRAWVGHAACYLATGCPEDVTREAWGLLSDKQRELANKQADNAIAKWESEHERKNFELDRKMGSQGIFQWDT